MFFYILYFVVFLLLVRFFLGMGRVMISELKASKSCYFFIKKSKVTSKTITELFRSVRSSYDSPSNNYFSIIREKEGAAYWSALCFQFNKTPHFLPENQTLIDRVTGYLLIVEYGEYVALFKSQIDVTKEFTKRYLRRLPQQQVDQGLTSENSIFDKVRLKHLTLSRFALHSKTLEGANLQNNVGMASSSSFAPLGYSFQESGEHYSTTPRTGRISLRADRTGYVDLVNYACDIINRMSVGLKSPPVSPFLTAFSRPVDLADLTANPSQFAVDTAILTQAIFDDKSIRLVTHNDGDFHELLNTEVTQILEDLTTVHSVTNIDSMRKRLVISTGGDEIGEIAINKTRIALRKLSIPFESEVYVEDTRFGVGQDNERQLLKQFIDKQDIFIILFDNPKFAYLDGSLYQDESLTNGGELFLGYFFGHEELESVSTEKGQFFEGQQTFDGDSTFGIILSTIAPDDNVMVCDDLGDEWADFIGFRTDPSNPRVTFYHAKHGGLSLGASSFHVSVGQAIKNLGNLSLPVSAMARKYNKWGEEYKNDKVITRISRTSRGTIKDVEEAVEFCRHAPHTMKRVAIVTSSLSKSKLAHEFAQIAAGQRADPYFVQLYWLLSSFFAACSEVGAFGCVMCQK